MNEYKKIQWTDLINSTFYILAPLLFANLVLGLILFNDLVFNKLLGIISLVLSLFFGYRLYKKRSHLEFCYDSREFTYKKGEVISKRERWSNFDKVTVIKTEDGDFAIKLYKGKKDFVIPTTRFKIDAQEFRFEVMKFIER